MPRLEVEGVGTLAFPVPASQVAQVMAVAARAPYGRGQDTLVDETVRRTWQVPADQVRLGGTAWLRVFPEVLGQVVAGLGCEAMPVSAELYKLLVYETGGFFKAHRDTEKTPGMFGTLVMVLPSQHEGGELVIRHAGREVVVDLASREFTDVRFAAFYADCEHEVRPVTAGHRVCLVFNLVLPRAAGSKPRAPMYVREAERAADALRGAFGRDNPPPKLAWLLEHQYSPAGLSFAALKGADAARGQVLREAARQADCAVHLGIVHIEEVGSAIVDDSGSRHGRGSRWGRGTGPREVEGVPDDGFEIIEPQSSSVKVDGWVDEAGRAMGFGELPVGQGELVPAGALDEEPPDEQRLTEATGNEGATYERSYHRAAVVLWPRVRFLAVLMQVGVASALPHLEERVDAGDPEATDLARQVVEGWHEGMHGIRWDRPHPSEMRGRMLRLLNRLGDAALIREFLPIFLDEGHGEAGPVAVRSLELLGAEDAREPLLAFVRGEFPRRSAEVVGLLGALAGEGWSRAEAWRGVMGEAAAALLEAIPALACKARMEPEREPWQGTSEPLLRAETVDGALGFLGTTGGARLRARAARAFVAGGLMEPLALAVPVLARMHGREPGCCARDEAAQVLWADAAGALLARSEHPPAPPKDWRQQVKIGCACEECRALQAFALDPVQRILRLRAAQPLRLHVSEQVRSRGLDMDCTTEATGRPHALVCVKNRRSHDEAARAHAMDVEAMGALMGMLEPVPDRLRLLATRLAAARARAGGPG